MRVLFFSHNLPSPVQPGLGTFNRTMLEGLSRLHEVEAVVPVSWTEQWRHWLKGQCRKDFAACPRPGVRTVSPLTAHVPTTYTTFYYPPGIARPRYDRFMAMSAGPVLRAAIRRFQPDVLLSYWSHPDGRVAADIAKEFGIAAAVMTGGSDVLILGRSGKRRESVLEALRWPTRIFTVSDDLRRVLVDDGIAADRIEVVRRGVNREVFCPGNPRESRDRLKLAPDVPLILAVGRLVPVKGWETLIDACGHLYRRGLTFQAVVAGKGPLQGSLEQRIREQQLESVVTLIGAKPQEELVHWYRAANVSVLTSVSEGVPNVLMESMACGTPFVASDVGGIREITDPVQDRLVPAGDSVALAAALEDRLRSHGSRTDQRRFEPLSLDAAARGLAAALQRTLDVHHGNERVERETSCASHTGRPEDRATCATRESRSMWGLDPRHGSKMRNFTGVPAGGDPE